MQNLNSTSNSMLWSRPASTRSGKGYAFFVTSGLDYCCHNQWSRPDSKHGTQETRLSEFIYSACERETIYKILGQGKSVSKIQTPTAHGTEKESPPRLSLRNAASL